MHCSVVVLYALLSFSLLLSAALSTTAPSSLKVTATSDKDEPDEPIINTSFGLVRGKPSVVPGVNEWLGIPYASPPIGSLRWKPPVPPASWNGTLNATSFSAACLQVNDSLGYTFPADTVFSEDCLYLNVWAPSAIGEGYCCTRVNALWFLQSPGRSFQLCFGFMAVL